MQSFIPVISFLPFFDYTHLLFNLQCFLSDHTLSSWWPPLSPCWLLSSSILHLSHSFSSQVTPPPCTSFLYFVPLPCITLYYLFVLPCITLYYPVPPCTIFLYYFVPPLMPFSLVSFLFSGHSTFL